MDTNALKLSEKLQKEFDHWRNFLLERVEFSFAESSLHTKSHCERLLYFALLIADRENISAENRAVLCVASVFHDSRRADDGFDIGHGERASCYYRSFCRETKFPMLEQAALIMAFHDRADALGEQMLSAHENGITLYRIFKDADALDRFRLGVNGLDAKFLRTQAAKEIYPIVRAHWPKIF